MTPRRTGSDPFSRWMRRWDLRPDGEPIPTPTGHLLPVVYRGQAAMLKLAAVEEEKRGARLLAWWAGNGAARVLKIEGPAVLMERATGNRSLAEMSRRGQDRQATSIILSLAAKLHAAPSPTLPRLVALQEWFRSLFEAAPAATEGVALAAATAKRLIETQADAVPLHGDLHHWNVLDFGGEWRAIDPKGLIGERTFDLVHLLRNPDPATAGAPGRLEQRADQVAREADVDKVRLLEWMLAFAGLSAAWTIEEGESPAADLAMLARARRLLGGS